MLQFATEIPLDLYGGTLLVLGVLCLGILLSFPLRSNRRPTGGVALPEGFAQFQQQYLLVYLLCTFSDWLKGPYVYALYEAYGFSKADIAWLFITGYLSSLIFGTCAGALSDRMGRKLMCQMFCVIYAASACTKVVNNFWVLLLGRALSGVATSLLFTTFEAWMVSEHQSRGFPAPLLTDTFSRATLGNGCVAVAAGIVAQVAAMWHYAMPFLVAIPCLLLALAFISRWTENYGSETIAPLATLVKGWQAIRGDARLRWLGLCEACFEGCMYVWVFFWTPAISTPETASTIPYGIVFASFMAAFMIGGALPQHFQVDTLALPVHLVAMATTAATALFFENKTVVFFAFAIFEGTVGTYFPTHGTIRSKTINEATRAAVMNLFRVPLNLYVIILLQFPLSTQQAFGVLALTHLASVLCFAMFRRAEATE
jgi:MFS family permease